MAIQITWGLLLLAIGGILGAIGILGVKNKQPRMILGWLAIAGIVIGILGVMGAIPQLQTELPLTAGLGTLAAGGANAPTQPTQTLSAGTSTICAVEDTTVTLSAQDKYLGTAVGGSHRYRIGGAPALVVADAGTFTASPGDILSVLWRNASTTGAYSSVNEYTVPCKGTYTAGDNGGAKLLSQNGSLTVTVFQDPGGLAISTAFTGGTNQTLAAGDIKNLKTLLQGQYQRDFPYGMTLVFEYNKTSIDDVIIQDRASGLELSSTSVPVSYTPAGWPTEGVRKAYLIPATMSNAEYQYTIVVDADDTQNPGSRGSDINMTFYPLNNYIDDKKGGVYAGPASEDEYNVLTRGGIGITQTIFVD